MFSKQAFDAHATQVHDVKTHQPGYIVASQNIRKQPIQQPQQTTGQVVLEKETTTKFKTSPKTNKAATTLGVLGTVVGLTILAYGASVLLKNKNKNPTASMMQRIKQNIGSTTSESGSSGLSGSSGSSTSSSSSSEYDQPITQKVKSRLRKLGLTASSDAQPQYAPGMSKKKFAAAAAVPVAAAKLKNKIGKKGFRSTTSDSSDYSSEEIEQQPAVVSSRIKGFWKRPVIVEEEEEVIEEIPSSVTTSTVSDISTSSLEDKKIKRKRAQRLRKLFNKKH